MTTALLELPKVTETGLIPKALAIKIRDAETFAAAAQILKDLVSERKEIIAQTEKVVSQAFQLHKSLKADQNELVKPIEKAESHLRNELGQYEQEQIRIRREAERKAEEERRKVEEEARLIAAAEAEKQGNNALSDAIMDSTFTPAEVVSACTATPSATYARKVAASGVSFTTAYDVVVTDKLAFIRWVASKPEFMHFLDMNETAVQAFAKSTQGAIQPTGIGITTKQVVRTTGR